MNTSTEKVYDIYYDQATGIVVMNWNGYATSEQFREGTETMLALLLANNAGKVLGNIKEMVIIGREDQLWLENIFLPRAIKFGFKAAAFVKPDHYFNKVAVEEFTHKVDPEKLAINFFDTAAEAKEWLLSQ
jgi:hypothetical protein